MGCLHGFGEPERPEVVAGIRWPRALPSQAPACAEATTVGVAAAARLVEIGGSPHWRWCVGGTPDAHVRFYRAERITVMVYCFLRSPMLARPSRTLSTWFWPNEG